MVTFQIKEEEMKILDEISSFVAKKMMSSINLNEAILMCAYKAQLENKKQLASSLIMLKEQEEQCQQRFN